MKNFYLIITAVFLIPFTMFSQRITKYNISVFYQDGSTESGEINFNIRMYDNTITSTDYKEKIKLKTPDGETKDIPTRNIHSILIKGDGEDVKSDYLLYQVPTRKIDNETGEISSREDVMFLQKFVDGPIEVYGYFLKIVEDKRAMIEVGSTEYENVFYSFVKFPDVNYAVSAKTSVIHHIIPSFASLSHLLKKCPKAKADFDEKYPNTLSSKMKYESSVRRATKNIYKEKYGDDKSIKRKEKKKKIEEIKDNLQLDFYREYVQNYSKNCL